jgi:hypothetical protein
VAAAALLPLLIGCGAGGSVDGAARFTVRDSAGVQLVHNAGSGEAVLPLREELRLGAIDGPEHLQFFRIFGIAVDANGRLYVVNSGSGELRVFERDGRYVRSMGRSGSGPGEFEFLSTVFLAGDTVVATDSRLNRATFFDTAGTLLGTQPLMLGSTQLILRGRSADGWLLSSYEQRGWSYQIGVPRQDTTLLALLSSWVDLERAPVPALRIPGRRMYGIQSPRAMTANAPLWEPQPEFALDGLGRIHLSAGSSYVIDTFVLAASSADGGAAVPATLVRRLTREHVPVAVTDALTNRYFAEVQTYYDTATAAGSEADIGRAAQLGRRSLPRPEALPPLRRIRAARDGALWVERPDLVDDPVSLEWTRGAARSTSWDVFDSDGRFIGTVELPPRFRVYAVDTDWVVGVLPDELGVEHVVRWQVP